MPHSSRSVTIQTDRLGRVRKGGLAIGITVASTAVVGALGIGLPLVSVAEPRFSITEFAFKRGH